MGIHVLASGSKGNAVFVSMGDTKLLLDAGISARRIQKGLEALKVDVGELDGVLLTHEHRDHVAGLPTLLKKYKLPLYTRPATWQALYCRDLLPAECFKPLAASQDIGEVKIEPFAISHDAAEPVGFTLHCRQTKYSLATDLGFVTDTVKTALALSDALVLETNHDLDMLQEGSYPWSLKRRIMSNRGHLANTDAGWTLARLPKKNSTQVFLAHLSQENNRPELAKKTVQDILLEHDSGMAATVTLQLTYPNQAANWPGED